MAAFAESVNVGVLSHLCSSPRCVTFDVEIQDEVEATGGWDATDRMRISVAVAHAHWLGRSFLFGDNDRERQRLIDLIMNADVVAGFNIWSFDLPLLFRSPRAVWDREHMVIAPGLAARVFDLMRHARLSLKKPLDGPCGMGLDLNSCAVATLGHAALGGKSAHGSAAPSMFQSGDLLRLHQYCMDDVWLESQLVDFARRHRYFLSGQGKCSVVVDPLWE